MADEFLTTRWSLVLAAAGANETAAGAAMEQLCREAWRPLYAFARQWGCGREDAEDAVQGFLASLLARQSLTQVESGRGRFRSFLLAGMRNHMSDLRSHARAAKRGGGASHLSMDSEAAEAGYAALAAGTESPARTFDRVWAMSVMEKARFRLGAECAASGKVDVFAALFPEPCADPPENYAALGARLGLSDTALRTLAMRLRRRWRDLIRAELAQTVSSRQALDDEMECLRAALRE
jgi:DNA-directed RNA polymerase specialized sigma24 family protein